MAASIFNGTAVKILKNILRFKNGNEIEATADAITVEDVTLEAGTVALNPLAADPSTPAEGTVQYSDGTARTEGIWIYKNSTWVELTSQAIQTAYIKDEQTSGTNAGDFTQGAWRTRVLNTVSGDTGIVSLSSNQITLPAGKYMIKATAPAMQCQLHQLRFQNVDDATTAITGGSHYADTGNAVNTQANLSGEVEILASKTFELQHQCSATKTIVGLGNGCGFGTEIFAQIEITKVS